MGLLTLAAPPVKCGHCARPASHRLPDHWQGWGGWPLCDVHYAPIRTALAAGWRYGLGRVTATPDAEEPDAEEPDAEEPDAEEREAA